MHLLSGRCRVCVISMLRRFMPRMNSEGSFDSLVDGLFPAPHSDNPWGGQWYGNLDGTAQTLEIEFPVVRMVNRVAVYSVRADNPNCDLLDFDLQYEKDGKWVTLKKVRTGLFPRSLQLSVRADEVCSDVSAEEVVMLENVDLSCRATRAQFKSQMPGLEIELAQLQRQIRNMNIPVILVFEGWDASGKSALINELIQPLDPRGFSVHNAHAANEEEAMRPFLWRFWTHTPERGRITVFNRSWYRRLLDDRVSGEVGKTELEHSFEDVRAFERQLAEDGNVIIKFFLHISKEEQKRRFRELKKDENTAWRVTKSDMKRHRQYQKYFRAADEMLARTDSEFAPWFVVEAHNQRYATLKIFRAVVQALRRRVRQEKIRKRKVRSSEDEMPVATSSILDQVDLSLTLGEKAYRRELKKKQKKLRDLEYRIYVARIPVVIVYEGWDAAGKGGNLRRLTEKLDPSGYEVVPVSAPDSAEKKHHYLWRFWRSMPKAGHITIFDRSWYGRVMVERVEGFCSELEWRRAYREIREMEQHMVNFGTVLVKLWLQIDPDEQLRRFRAREEDSDKRWKITDEDWRNRKKWKAYGVAVREMLRRTSTPLAPWTVVESNSKRHARIKSMDTVIRAIEARL